MSAAQTLPPPTPSRPVEPVTEESGHHDHNAHQHAANELDLNVPTPRPMWIVIAGVIGITAIIAMLVTGLIPRREAARQLIADAADAQNAPVMVNLATPKRSPAQTDLAVPGTLRPWQEVSIFARTTGYLKDYFVDISEPIEKGKPMAVIESPEVDQELNQATAALQQTEAAKSRAQADRTKAKADMTLAETTLHRYEKMRETQGITLQQLDEKQGAMSAAQAQLQSAEANVASAVANVAAATANVDRLKQLQGFKTIIAPFSGVVTGRAYDRGSLITANPTATDIKPLFKIAQNDVLRAFVNVPQSSALQIRKGMKVSVTARERPGVVFPGVVMGTTNYLDPTNRSLLTEVKVTNQLQPGGEFSLLPGMYVSTTFSVTQEKPPLLVPAPAIVNNADGTQVVIMVEGKAHYVKVALGRDFGSDIEIVEGLNGDEQVITNPGERTVEGALVSGGT